MKDETKFIKLADQLLWEDMALEQSFETCLLPFLKNNDYDSFSTLYYLLLGKQIKGDLDNFRKQEDLSQLPPKLEPTLAQEYDTKVSDWQSRQKQLWYDVMQSVLHFTEKYYSETNPMPTGMREYMERCGNVLIKSTLLDGNFTKRGRDLVFCFLALGYKEHIKRQRVRSEYIEGYELAQKFVQEYKVYLPYYYAVAGELWYRNAPDSSKDLGYISCLEFNRLLLELPDVYKQLLYGHYIYSDNPRTETVISGMGKNGIEPLAITKLSVPFDSYLPTFHPGKRKEDEYRECSSAPGAEKDFYYHPMTRTQMPFTHIYCKTDMQLYLDNVYKTIELDMLHQKVQDLEKYLIQNSSLDETGNFDSESQKQRSKGQNLSTEQIQKLVAEIKKRLTNKSKSFEDWVRDGHNPERSLAIQQTLKQANIRRNILSRAKRSNQTQKKDTVITLAFAFGYSWEEAQQFIAAAGYCLSDSIERDIVIRYALEQNLSLASCNEILEGLNFDTIRGKANQKS